MRTHDLVIGLVGAGGIAQTYAQAFQNRVYGRISGVVDTRREAAAAMAEVLGCESYGSIAELAEAGHLDAVIVCTPPASHASICQFFLERSVHVMCEKPLSIDPGDARRMIRTAREAGRLLVMASKFRYVEDVVKAKSLLVSGLLGVIGAVRIQFLANVNMKGRWNSDGAVSGGGVLIDNGTHAVDLVRYLVGPIDEVFAAEGTRIQGLEVEESVHAILRTSGGLLATMDLSWSMPSVIRDYVEVACSGGAISVGWKESGYRRLPAGDWACFGHGYSKLHAIRRQVENFTRAIAGEEGLLISELDQLASVEVISAAYRSLASGRWEKVARDAAAQGVA